MVLKSIADINQYAGTSVDPSNTPNTTYELYSVPSFDQGFPEIIKGSGIGSTKITVEEGDILICKINPRINRVWVVKHHTMFPLVASSEWIVVRNGEIDSNYLKWYFSSPSFRKLIVSQVAGIGGSLTRAQPKQVAKYPVPIPDFSTQQAIASILDKLDNLISLRKEQLAKLDELVKARFVEIFGDPEHNPQRFSVEKLCNLCEIGSSKRIYQNEQCHNGVPFLRVSDLCSRIDNGTETSKLFIPNEKYTELFSQGLVPAPGDILVTSRGTLGRCYIIKDEDRFYFQDGMISWLSHFDCRVINQYIAYLFTMPYIQKQILSLQAGSTIAYLSISMLKKLDILLPSPQLQQQFTTLIEQVNGFKLTIQQSLDKLEVLKKSLMQEYFG